MSSYSTEAGFVDLADNVSAIAPSEACEGFNTSSKSTPPPRTNIKALIGTV